MILAIDPGIRGCGVALFFPGGHLYGAAYVRNPTPKGDDPEAIRSMAAAVMHAIRADLQADPANVSDVVVEWPQVYQGSKQKGDPNDLIALGGVDAAIVALLPHARAHRYRPREWKGQAPANVCAARIVGRLADAERERVAHFDRFGSALARAVGVGREVGGTDHNTIDAVGVGLKFVGRFDPRKVYGG